MTRSTSAVAVCCSSASVSSRLRASQLLEQPRVLDGDDGLVGERLEQRDLPVGERSRHSLARDGDGADGLCPRAAAALTRHARQPSLLRGAS